MPQPSRFYGENDLHYLTSSTYRRAAVFNSERFRREFVATLAELRPELRFRLLGYVLMPEHFHLLIWPSEAANPSQIMQRLKGAHGAVHPGDVAPEPAAALVRQNAGSVFAALDRARRGKLPRVATAVFTT